jgi:Arc/MetJ-type ribon-helix-helix transcriptional regulator
MRRTTVTLTDELAAALVREATRRHVSASEIAREALAEHLGIGGEGVRPIPFAALGASGERHTARDAESILEREWGDARRR